MTGCFCFSLSACCAATAVYLRVGLGYGKRLFGCLNADFVGGESCFDSELD